MGHVVAAGNGRDTRSPCDLLIIGGGPAGLAAAATAGQHGLRVIVLDERPTPGGQVYKQPGPGFRIRDPARLGRDYQRGISLATQAIEAGAELRAGVEVVALDGTSAIVVAGGSSYPVRAGRLLIAAGAHDRPVAFPGWTLPGVVTAGGAQALVKASRIVPGNRVAFAGSGPLALAFPAQLRHYGVNVVLVLESGPARARGHCSASPAPPPGTASCCATPPGTGGSWPGTGYRRGTAGSSSPPRETAG